MSSFAVQTIQNLLKRLSSKLLIREQAQEGVGDGAAEAEVEGKVTNGQLSDDINKREDEEMQMPEDLKRRLARDHPHNYRKSHTDFVTEEHKRLQERISRTCARPGDSDVDVENAANAREEEREQEEDRILTEYVLELAVELEKHARRLLLGHMKEGSDARMLLKADRIVQLRNIRSIAMLEEDGIDDDDDDESKGPNSNVDSETRRVEEKERPEQVEPGKPDERF